MADPLLHTILHALLLVLVGLTAGMVSIVVSLASIVSYPALLALGLPPVAANVTNTVALTFTSLGSLVGARRELRGLARTVIGLGLLTTLGGASGAALLLLLPGAAFGRVAPVLIAAACGLLLIQPRLQLAGRMRPRGLRAGSVLALVAATTYTGYFGAAGGIIILVVLGGVLDLPLIRINAVKNALSGFANGVAAIGFALFGPVDWPSVAPLAIGFLLGGWLGPSVARRIPTPALRRAIVLTGFGVACWLAWDAYV